MAPPTFNVGVIRQGERWITTPAVYTVYITILHRKPLASFSSYTVGIYDIYLAGLRAELSAGFWIWMQ